MIKNKLFKLLLPCSLALAIVGQSHALVVPTVDVQSIAQLTETLSVLRQQLSDAKDFYNNNINNLKSQLTTQVDTLRKLSGFNEIKGLYEESQRFYNDIKSLESSFEKTIGELRNFDLKKVYALTDKEAYDYIVNKKLPYSFNGSVDFDKYIKSFENPNSKGNKSKVTNEIKNKLRAACQYTNKIKMNECIASTTLAMNSYARLAQRQESINQQLKYINELSNSKPQSVKDSIDLANQINAKIQFLNISLKNQEEYDNEIRKELRQMRSSAEAAQRKIEAQALRYQAEKDYFSKVRK